MDLPPQPVESQSFEEGTSLCYLFGKAFTVARSEFSNLFGYVYAQVWGKFVVRAARGTPTTITRPVFWKDFFMFWASPKVTLLEQHRMPLCIAAFPNQQYYHGKLMTRARAPCRPPRGFRWPSYDAVCFIDAFGPGEQRDRTSLYNAQEASAIADAFFWLHDGGDVESSEVVVVSFYQRQVREICSALQHRRVRVRVVTTVDGFQGSEASVVIVSTVLCNTSGQMGFA